MKIIGDELTAVDNFGVMEFQGYKLVLLKVLHGVFRHLFREEQGGN